MIRSLLAFGQPIQSCRGTWATRGLGDSCGKSLEDLAGIRADLFEGFDGPQIADDGFVAFFEDLLDALADLQRQLSRGRLVQGRFRRFGQLIQFPRGLLPDIESVAVEIGNELGEDSALAAEAAVDAAVKNGRLCSAPCQ